MANFIQKFADMQEYNDADHQYPNISLVDGEGLVWVEEAPEPDVLLNASKIRWNVTDGQERTSVDYPSISFEDAQTLINALNNGDELVATGWYDDGEITIEDAEITYTLDNSGFPTFSIFDSDSDSNYNLCYVGLFTNAKAPAYNATAIIVSKYGGNARWEINYEIHPAENPAE